MAKTKAQIAAEKAAQVDDRREADDYWWLIVRTPAREIHVYELGYTQDVEVPTDEVDEKTGEPVTETHKKALTDERQAVIMTELGAPVNAGAPESGWALSMAPGRPNAYVEPKEYDLEGELLPIKARAGVTLHLAPEDEPGVGDSEE